MTFAFNDDLIHQYHTMGYVVLRHILPTSLVRDLRREAEKGRELARRLRGPNAQRLQPIKNYPELDLKPFYNYAELPELIDALQRLVSPDIWIGGPDEIMGILYEPAERPWATSWHRDFGPFQRRVDPDVFRLMRQDFRYFHQVNCALYEDNATWYIPGSHHRDDFPEEVHLTRDYPWQIGMDQPELDTEMLERYCLEYVEMMPRAVRLHLDAGDFALYRNHGFHLGCYVPYKKRATLHDTVLTPEWAASMKRWGEGGPLLPTANASKTELSLEPSMPAAVPA